MFQFIKTVFNTKPQPHIHAAPAPRMPVVTPAVNPFFGLSSQPAPSKADVSDNDCRAAAIITKAAKSGKWPMPLHENSQHFLREFYPKIEQALSDFQSASDWYDLKKAFVDAAAGKYENFNKSCVRESLAVVSANMSAQTLIEAAREPIASTNDNEPSGTGKLTRNGLTVDEHIRENLFMPCVDDLEDDLIYQSPKM